MVTQIDPRIMITYQNHNRKTDAADMAERGRFTMWHPKFHIPKHNYSQNYDFRNSCVFF